MLTPEFEREIDQLLGHVPKARTNFLFSATSNDKVQHLMRAVLRNPVHIKIKNKYAYCFPLIFFRSFMLLLYHLMWVTSHISWIG